MSARWRPSSRRVAAWWASSSSRQRRSPSAAACFVESTISVKRIVAKNRFGDRRDRNTFPASLRETWSLVESDEHRYDLNLQERRRLLAAPFRFVFPES